jgi:hypothetical protein
MPRITEKIPYRTDIRDTDVTASDRPDGNTRGVTFATIKAWLKAYFDGLYATVAALLAESQTRADGDQTNADAIGAEEVARVNADTVLGGRIDGAIKLQSATTQIIDSDVALAMGRKLSGTAENGTHNLVELDEDGQVKVGDGDAPLRLRHRVQPGQPRNIPVDLENLYGDTDPDQLAYLSDLSAKARAADLDAIEEQISGLTDPLDAGAASALVLAPHGGQDNIDLVLNPKGDLGVILLESPEAFGETSYIKIVGQSEYDGGVRIKSNIGSRGTQILYWNNYGPNADFEVGMDGTIVRNNLIVDGEISLGNDYIGPYGCRFSSAVNFTASIGFFGKQAAVQPAAIANPVDLDSCISALTALLNAHRAYGLIKT